jgi:hypothetical protein
LSLVCTALAGKNVSFIMAIMVLWV